MPATTTLDSRPEKRQGRIYLDTTRNARGQAVAVAYCARPHPGATVSTPLKSSEVRRGLDPGNFTIKTMAKRIDRFGDLWQTVLREGIDLADCLKEVATAMGAVTASDPNRCSGRTDLGDAVAGIPAFPLRPTDNGQHFHCVASNRSRPETVSLISLGSRLIERQSPDRTTSLLPGG